MKQYNVKEISRITGTNEETVRRWFRDGKLPNSISVQGKDKLVSELDLISFLRNYPKYMSKTMNNLSNYVRHNKDSLILGATIGVVGGGLMALLADMIDDKKDIERTTILAIDTEIELSKNQIDKTSKEIELLNTKLEREKEYLNQLETKRKEIEHNG